MILIHIYIYTYRSWSTGYCWYLYMNISIYIYINKYLSIYLSICGYSNQQWRGSDPSSWPREDHQPMGASFCPSSSHWQSWVSTSLVPHLVWSCISVSRSTYEAWPLHLLSLIRLVNGLLCVGTSINWKPSIFPWNMFLFPVNVAFNHLSAGFQ